jgi:hypothetical protein
MAVRPINELRQAVSEVPFLDHALLTDLVDTFSSRTASPTVFIPAGSSMNWMAPQRLVSSKWRWYYDTGVPVPASELIWVSVNGSTSQGADAPDTGGYGALRMAVVENTGFWDGEPSSDGKLYVSTRDPEGGADIVTVIPKGVCVAFARTSEDAVNKFGNVTEGWRPVVMPVGIRLEDMP